ncbi:glycosyltransferase family 2 protein [Seohaeicola saemankumensis]|uniref:Glycosyltransferase family 2 protein n=1 Tax=Seohaeicola saemankumensis TaxID=481181 RepID=A0ABW3TB88_9RHOB
MLFWTSGDPPATAQEALPRDEMLRAATRPAGPSVLPRGRVRPDLGRYLVDRRLVSVGQMLSVRAQMRRDNSSLAAIALNEGWLTADQLLQARADCFALRQVDLMQQPPDPALARELDPATCLRLGMMPWRETETGIILMATARPEDFADQAPDLPAPFHCASPVLVDPANLEAAIAQQWRDEMRQAALTRVPADESCRGWAVRSPWRKLAMGTAVLSLLMLVLVYPVAVFAVLAAWAMATLAVAALHKAAAVLAFLTARGPLQDIAPHPGPAVPDMQPLSAHQASRPVVTILVPLYREPEVADILIRRLERLQYPKALLDVLLILEENDHVTSTALAQVALPHWMRVIPVPDGQPRTKPRAMNYALDFARGQIIGIYDAEDAPDPDQIDRVVARFASAPPDLVCLQGVLDYYNPRQNWLARCFTIEYAAWFRVMMPGMARLGFAIPLGGTTLFFRRDALDRLGGWDAHNVTEDADLGFRLARHGYRTEMIATTTGEEANCHPLPWVKQRSRWLKGYMVTYLVHMRRPVLLFRQLGAWRFLGYQTHFITALSQFLLAPVLWSFWLVLLGLPHPLDGLIPEGPLIAMARLFLMVELLTIATGLLAVSGPAHRHLLFWVPTLHFYFPLGVLAAYKALYELIFAPFFWDKTMHGHSLQARPRRSLLARAFTRRS